MAARRTTVARSPKRLDLRGDAVTPLPSGDDQSDRRVSKLPVEDVSVEEFVDHKVKELLQRVDGYGVDNLHVELMNRVEKPLLRVVMDYTQGNQVRAAEILGLNRNTLRRKLEDHDLKLVSGKPERPKPNRTAKLGAPKRTLRNPRS